MAPDVTSQPSICPACGASAALDANYCLACGEALPRAQPGMRRVASMRIVEADAAELSDDIPLAETALATQETPPATLATRLATLATVAWRQPAVRSVVTTGASAVALSLVWRAAGAALTAGRARRALVPTLAEGESLAPMVGDLLRGATPGKRLRRRGRRGEIVEEIVYIRRVFRR